MKLTDEELQIVIKKFKGLNPKGLICPVCGNNKWNLSNLVYEINEYEKEENINGTKHVIPLITLSCKYCYNTLFFNAIGLGIIEKDIEKNNDSDTSKE